MNRFQWESQVSQRAPSTTYQSSLAQMTYWGAFTACCFHAIFALIYWMLAYPLVLVLSNAIPMLFDFVLFSLQYFRPEWRQRYRFQIANALTGLIYISLLIPAIITGGIASSSILWLLFINVVVFLMAGTRWGMLWMAVCMFSAIILYALDEVLISRWILIPSTNLDRAMDLTLVLAAIGVSVWISEIHKGQAVHQLETIQEKLHHLAISDPLTQIFNRRHFFERAQEEVEKVQNNLQRSISLILFDVDHFKRVNDQYGHLVGDRVLIDIVTFCQSHLREMDFIARFGGEEFVIMLPQTGQKDAYLVAERIRQEIVDAIIPTDCGPVQISISVGVASIYPDSICSLSELVRRADQALYQSKQTGRNRTTIWQPD